ncbi:MAG: hypothetical protein AAF289_15825 [Cyanobacteria bacterium P01_A01_bin.135]
MNTIQLKQPARGLASWSASHWSADRPSDYLALEWTGTTAANAIVDIPAVIASPDGTLVLKQTEPIAKQSFSFDPSDRFLPISVAAGVTLVAAVGVLDQVSQAPTYEAKIEIAVPSVGQNSLSTQTQIEVMESPLLIEPVVDQLRSHSVDITYDSLIQSLTIEAQGESFDIRYRHGDADTAETVINELSAAYLNYGQSCHQPACRGLTYINAQLPYLQRRVEASRAELRQMHTNALAPDQQVKLLTARTTSVKRQTIDVDQRLAGAYRDRDLLQEKLGLPANTPVTTLLQRDAPYQQQLHSLRQVEQQIALEFGRVQSDSGVLRALYQQHSAISSQLQQEAQGGLQRFFANPRGPVDPVLQQPLYSDLLLKLIGVVHQIEVLELRQKTVAQAEERLAIEMTRVASLLRRYEALQQELTTSTRILSNYLDRQAELQDVDWQMVSPPEVAAAEQFELPTWLRPETGYYTEAIAGLAAAGVAGAVMLRRRSQVLQGELCTE